MKSFQRANINAFFSALIWGVIMSLVIKVSFSSLTNQRLVAILQYGSVLLYPVLVSIIVRKKTELWLNPCYFSLMGGMTSFFLSLNLLSVYQNIVWTNIVFLFIFIAMVLYSIPQVEPALQHDWNSPFWEKLNQSSFIEFFFLQFHSIDNNAG